MKKSKKIIYIIGAPRSGTTLMDNMLNEVPGFFSVGETSFLWERGVKNNMYCGCKKKFKKCPFWSEVMNQVAKVTNDESINQILDVLSTFSIHKLLFLFGYKTKSTSNVVKHLEVLYKNIFGKSKSDVIIDSSKWPIYPLLLSELKEVDIYMIYIIRDPRATAHSWFMKKKYEEFNESSVIMYKNKRSAYLEWFVWNFVAIFSWIKLRKKWMVLTYGSFSKDPHSTIEKILEFIGEKDKKNPVLNGVIRLNGNHCVSGNPVRFKRGLLIVQEDTGWKGL